MGRVERQKTEKEREGNPTYIFQRTNNVTTSHAGIYSIPCKVCDKQYICETQQNIEKRIYGHKWLIKLNDDRNTLFTHILDLKHTFNFFQAILIKPIHCKKKIPQIVRICSHCNQISPYLANITLHENNIKIENRWEILNKKKKKKKVKAKIFLTVP